MKVQLCALLLLVAPLIGRGQGISVADSSDWRPLERSQLATLNRQISQVGGRLVDASSYVQGGTATMMSVGASREVSQQSAEAFIASFIQGVVEKGPRFVDREKASIGGLPGASLRFQAEPAGKIVGMVAYIVFTNRESYALSLYAPGAVTRTDPLVTSYLARIKIAPSVIPGDIYKLPQSGASSPSDRLAFDLGCVFGIAVVVWFFIKRKKRRNPPLLPVSED